MSEVGLVNRRARSVLALTEENERRTNHVAMPALASYRPWRSAREKIIENGSLQLEICYPARLGRPSRSGLFDRRELVKSGHRAKALDLANHVFPTGTCCFQAPQMGLCN